MVVFYYIYELEYESREGGDDVVSLPFNLNLNCAHDELGVTKACTRVPVLEHIPMRV